MHKRVLIMTLALSMLTLMLQASQGRAELLSDSRSIHRYASHVQNDDWHGAIVQALKDTPSGGVIYFPRGDYRVDRPIEITQSISLLFEAGGTLWTPAEELIRIIAGQQIILESVGGRASLVNRSGEKPIMNVQRDYPTGNITSVISLDHVALDAQPSLRIHRMNLEGYRCVEGLLSEQKGPMGLVEVIDCHLVAQDMHMSHRHSEVRQLRVENSLFTGNARRGIYFTSPMPGGAIVRGNILKNIGTHAIQLSGGKVNMIADGAVEYLPSAIVHDNQILGGGHRATIHSTYIHGILVYGHNVSIQGNIVRDFNRGEPVPGEPYGHHMPMPDGSYYRGIWIEDEGRSDHRGRRLAGAAIYAKARQGIISGNICTNSGWRSVIEVKTGGREPYVMVTNNLVDGSSLCIEGSYGFEPSSGQSVWAGNLVYNMPDTAFAVRRGMQNSYINNVIVNAKAGFSFRSPGAVDEVLMNNRFINVQQPVAGVVADQIGPPYTPTSPIVVAGHGALPEPSEAQRGRFAVVMTQQGDQVLICQYVDAAYRWVALRTQDAGQAIGPVSWNTDQFEVVGENLLLNPDQSQDGPQEGDASSADGGGPPASFPFGWSVSTDTSADDVMAYDLEMYEHGTRSLRVGDGDRSFRWQISQHARLTPGKLYLAEAWVRASSQQAQPSLIVEVGSQRRTRKLDAVDQWERVSVMFELPPEHRGRVRLRLWGSQAGDGHQVWIDRVTLYEVQPRGN